MDLQQLVVVLQHCISPQPAERTAAEQALNQHQWAKGHVVNLLRASVEESVDESIRQVAAISFKNSVKKGWEVSEEEAGVASRFDDEDKAIVRSHLLEAIIRAPSRIKVQLAECLKSIVYSDYPEKWPDLLPAVMQNLQTQDHARIHGALYCLRILARKYEFKDPDERGPLGEVINNVFPTMLQIFQAVLAEGNRTLEMAELLRLICKTFWSSTFMAIPPCLLQHDQFVGWMTCFHTLIVMPVPTEGMPVDVDQRPTWPWWKVKKWVLHITNRLFSRYSDPNVCKEGDEQAFATMLSRDCVPKFLEAILQLMASTLQGQWLSPRVINLTLHILTYCISRNETYKLLKPHMNQLLISVVFPIMCFDDYDAGLWQDDPQEYIRKGYDIMEEMYNPRTAAMNFLHEVCKVRGKLSLDFYMSHVVQCFDAYISACGGGIDCPVKEARQMDGALLSVGTLYDVLKKKKQYRGNLENMLMRYIHPVFQSRWGHLRAKACWVGGMYCGTTFKDPKNFQGLLTCVFACLQDRELPVRMDAVVAVRHFVDAMEDISPLKPILPQLLHQFFQLLNEVENEDLVMTLETIVEKFGDEIAPYAVGLCENLSVAFWKITGQEDNDDEDEDELDSSVLAAFGCLRAITTVLESMSSLTQLYPKLEEILFPLMYKMCSSDGQEIFEEIVEIISYFTYFSPKISPQLWMLWPRLHECVVEWAVDYFDNILVPIDNFINRDTETFLAKPEYLASTLDMATKVLTNDNVMETDMVPACKMLAIVLQNCQGRVDDQVGAYLDLALGRLRLTENKKLQSNCMEVVANALYYNPLLTMQQLAHKGALQYVFTSWFTMISKTSEKSGKMLYFKQINNKKICVLGLGALLQLPTDAVPPEVHAGMPQVFQGVVHLLVKLKEQMEAAEKEGDGEDDGEDDEDDQGAGGDADNDDADDDDADDDESEYLKKLAAKARAIRLGEQSDDSDDDFSIDDEVQTPIDDIDPFVTFSDMIASLQSNDQQKLGILTSSADDTVRAAVQMCMQFAEHRRVQIAKRKEQEAVASIAGAQ